ncbi:MAG: hypothetical protein KAI83_03635 [Thiomargarita sp.]|nr:hypothetical protein [Thiomargarita sp.]
MPDLDLLCELLRKEAMIALEDGDYGKKRGHSASQNVMIIISRFWHPPVANLHHYV